MEECEECNRYFKLWINWSTIVMEDNTEHKICDYCCKDFITNYKI